MHKNTSCLTALGISFSSALVDGVDLVITTGTGEGTFAYDANDIGVESVRYDALSEADQDAYDYSADFCDHVSPVDDRDTAVALATLEDIWIDRAGACTAVLTAGEYKLIRQVVSLLR